MPRVGFPGTDLPAACASAFALSSAAAARAASANVLLGAIEESLPRLTWYNRSRQLGYPASSTCARLAVVLAAATTLCGCGASSDPLHEVVGATKKTLALSGVSYIMTLERPRLFGPSIETVGGRAAYDFRAGLGYEALTLQRRNGGKRTVYIDFLPAAVYVAPWPTPAGLLPAGKIWIEVAFTGHEAPANRPLASQLEGLAPELPLEEIAWGARAASHVGTRVVRHVPMEKYRVSVDLAKALSTARRAGRVAVAEAIESELRAARSGRVSLDVLVTGAGHIAKIDATVPGSGLGTASFSFASFHAQFNRNHPRQAQVVPLASITEPRFLWTIATRS